MTIDLLVNQNYFEEMIIVIVVMKINNYVNEELISVVCLGESVGNELSQIEFSSL